MSIVLNAMQLRALGEWASGYRGEVIQFYETADGRIGLWRPEKRGECPHPVILTCDTPFVVKDRPRVTMARLGTREDSIDLLRIPVDEHTTVAADAAFWSESAVEKFLFPYYVAKGSWAADLYAEALRTVFYGRRSLWWYKDAQEHPGEFMDPTSLGAAHPGAEEDEPLEGLEEEPFGLVHIPKSDYIPEDQEQTAQGESRPLPPLATGGELGVLLRHREKGTVRVRMLGEMVRERKQAPAAQTQPAY